MKVKVRKYAPVDTSKMKRAELAAYRKHLAQSREYVRAKRAWQKLVNAGKINPQFITLEKYRRVLAKGKPIESLTELKRKVDKLPQRLEFDKTKIERLLRELARHEKSKNNPAISLEDQILELIGA